MKFKNLGRYRTGGTDGNLQLGVPAPRTPDGRVYRFSPNENAQPRHFVIGPVAAEIPLTDGLRARMKLEPRSRRCVCPYSGAVGSDDDFLHPEDRDAALEMVKHAAMQDVEDAVADILASAFGRRTSRRGPVSISTKLTRSAPTPTPRFARRDLMRELVCDHCGRDYGVFAIGLFCPDCGAPNLRLHFARETELVADQAALAEGLADSKQELAYRLLGNAHEDVLTAFEATLKTVYIYGKARSGSGATPKVGNEFQNVEKGRRRFAELGLDPFDTLSGLEMAALELNIQKRHVIGHNLSVVDDKFATQTADAKVGQTVQLVGDDIREFAAVGQKVVDQLDAWLGGAPSPTIGHTPLVLTMKEPTATPDDPKNLMKLDLQLSLLARRIALWTAEQCTDGMRNYVDDNALRAAFADKTEAELGEAIAELKLDGFVQTFDAMGQELPSFRPSLDLYMTFDGVAFGTDPIADAVELAEMALAYERGVDVDDLAAKTGWTLRRFNPIIDYVASQIPDGRVSRHMGTELSVDSFFLVDEDRVAIRRFIKRLKG